MSTNKATAEAHGKKIGRPVGTGHPYAPSVARKKLADYCDELRTTRERIRWITRQLRDRRVPFDGLLETRAIAIAMQCNELLTAARALEPRRRTDGR